MAPTHSQQMHYRHLPYCQVLLHQCVDNADGSRRSLSERHKIYSDTDSPCPPHMNLLQTRPMMSPPTPVGCVKEGPFVMVHWRRHVKPQQPIVSQAHAEKKKAERGMWRRTAADRREQTEVMTPIWTSRGLSKGKLNFWWTHYEMMTV